MTPGIVLRRADVDRVLTLPPPAGSPLDGVYREPVGDADR
jgi:hypothetical protein